MKSREGPDDGGGESQRKESGEKNRPSDGQAKAADHRADAGSARSAPARRSSAHSPDQDALVLQPLPQRAIALVRHGEDVRRDLAEVVAAVVRHSLVVVQTQEQLVRVHRRQDGADVGLRKERAGR